MKDIGLESCGINDSDLYELLRTARNITHISLSHNSNLTSISNRYVKVQRYRKFVPSNFTKNRGNKASKNSELRVTKRETELEQEAVKLFPGNALEIGSEPI